MNEQTLLFLIHALPKAITFRGCSGFFQTRPETLPLLLSAVVAALGSQLLFIGVSWRHDIESVKGIIIESCGICRSPVGNGGKTVI